MIFQRCRNGAYPVVMDVPVYDAALLAAGEMVMRGAHGGTTNSIFITAYTGANTEAVLALGVLQEGSTSVTALAATGFNYLKCIINDDAHYLAEYFQTTGNVIDVDNASTGTTVTIGSLETSTHGGWLYFTEKTTAGATGAGNLRYITIGGSGSCTIDSAVTIDTTSDCIKILPVGHRVTELDATAIGLLSGANAPAGISLMVVESYISKAGLKQPLRYASHKATSGLNKDTTKFYAEIAMLNHAYHLI